MGGGKLNTEDYRISLIVALDALIQILEQHGDHDVCLSITSVEVLLSHYADPSIKGIC